MMHVCKWGIHTDSRLKKQVIHLQLKLVTWLNIADIMKSSDKQIKSSVSTVRPKESVLVHTRARHVFTVTSGLDQASSGIPWGQRPGVQEWLEGE